MTKECACGKRIFFDRQSGQWLHVADWSSTAWCRKRERLSL